MVPDLTAEHRSFAEAVEAFCRRECGTRQQRDALTAEAGHAHSPELYAKVARLGWLGVGLPEKYGGSGGGAVEMCLFLETTSRALAPLGGWTTSIVVAGAYKRFGSEEQKEAVLGGVADGAVASIAMSEPGRGLGRRRPRLPCDADPADGALRTADGGRSRISKRAARGDF